MDHLPLAAHLPTAASFALPIGHGRLPLVWNFCYLSVSAIFILLSLSFTTASGIAGGCVPTQPWVINKTPRCTGKNQVWSWSKWVCTKSTVPGPQPTHHYKRKEAMVPRTCPVSYTACAVTSEGILSGYECLDTDVELESCGGCASIGEGQDCTAIPGAWNIGCNQGKCEGIACLPASQWSGSDSLCSFFLRGRLHSIQRRLCSSLEAKISLFLIEGLDRFLHFNFHTRRLLTTSYSLFVTQLRPLFQIYCLEWHYIYFLPFTGI